MITTVILPHSKRVYFSGPRYNTGHTWPYRILCPYRHNCADMRKYLRPLYYACMCGGEDLSVANQGELPSYLVLAVHLPLTWGMRCQVSVSYSHVRGSALPLNHTLVILG
jgi:uncharacterized protein (DUF983 family)